MIVAVGSSILIATVITCVFERRTAAWGVCLSKLARAISSTITDAVIPGDSAVGGATFVPWAKAFSRTSGHPALVGAAAFVITVFVPLAWKN